MGTKEKASFVPSRERKMIQDRLTHERGQVVRVYGEGWLLAEMEDGTWRLFKLDEIELVKEGGR